VAPVEVVVAADVLVAALSKVSAAAIRFPAVPPKTNDPNADVIGVFVGAEGDFALILSPEILEQVAMALLDNQGLAWAFDAVDQAIDVLVRIAEHSHGGIATPLDRVAIPPHVHAALAVAALRTAASSDMGFPRAIVTGDPALQRLRLWHPRGTPWPAEQPITILSPSRFRDLVEQARWRYRRM
jgi:hypothetical protein